MYQTNETTNDKNFVTEFEDMFVFHCPHCDMITQVLKNEINCKIFRHAVYKDTYQQVNPHAPKEYCDSLIQKGLIYGCAKPFRFMVGNPNYVEKCDYI